MSLLTTYHAAIQKNQIQPDPKQLIAATELERIYVQLVKHHKHRQAWWGRMIRYFYRPKPVYGYYLWGGVGIGKTFLLDLFYQQLPFKQKLRCHFHEFMRTIHQQLKVFQGKKNPLNLIAKQFSKRYKVVCFDEFLVQDIGDAMILGQLMRALFEAGVTIITTSNVEPDELYLNGLQRDLFLPTIDLIKRKLLVRHLTSCHDYRHTPIVSNFYYPITSAVEEKMQNAFITLANDVICPKTIIVNHREIETIACSGQVVWFDFRNLCSIPRSQNDYLELAERFPYFLLSHLRQIKPEEDHLITYFIYLIDVLYDKKIQLLVASSVPIDKIYPSGRKVLEFERTQSRLREMCH